MPGNYQDLISEIIQKQIDILGPEMAVRKAKNVAGLSVGDDGRVLSVTGDAAAVLQNLVDQYIALSGEIVKNILNPVFMKYPEIKVNLN